MAGRPLPSEEEALIAATRSVKERARRRQDLEEQHQDAGDVLDAIRADLAVPRG